MYVNLEVKFDCIQCSLLEFFRWLGKKTMFNSIYI